MNGLLSGDIDAAEAMTYNEYAQVLEAKNPATGELYTPDDLNVVSYEERGRRDAAGRDLGRRGPARRRPAYCGQADRVRHGLAAGLGVLPRQPRDVPRHRRRKGSKLGATHQLWQMNEINKLIWPSTIGVGVIDQAAWDRTVEIARRPRTSTARRC